MLLLLIAASASAATGLALVKPTTLDPVEYEQVIRIVVDSSHLVKECKTLTIDTSAIDVDTETLIEYESHLPGLDNNLYVTKEIQNLLNQLKDKDTMSVRYCQHKVSEVQVLSRTLARAMGGLHQYNICDSDVRSRFDVYQASYRMNYITKAEFKELTKDIERLAEADRKNCSTDEQVKMDQAIDEISKASSLISAF